MAARVSAALRSRPGWRAVLASLPLLGVGVVLAPYLWPPDRAPTSLRNDLHTYHGPTVAALSRSLREEGAPPRWNPRDFAGMPLVGDPQAGVYSPVHWLLALWPSPRAFGLLIAASAALGALGFLALARSSGLGWSASAGGAAVFALGGSALFRLVALGHLGMAPVFGLPWALLGLHRVVRRPSLAGALALALGVAFLSLWMHPQVALYAALFGVAAGAARLRGCDAPAPAALTLAGVAVFAAALAAVHWLPSLAMLGEFARFRPELAAATAGETEGGSLLGLVTGAARHPEARVHLGGAALLFALLGAARSFGAGRRRAEARLLLGAALAIAVAALGLDEVASLGGAFRHPERLLILLTLPVAGLVALGLDAPGLGAPGLGGLDDERGARPRTALALAALVSGGALLAGGASLPAFAAWGASGMAALGLASARPGAPRHAAGALAVAALVFEPAAGLAPGVRSAPAREIGVPPPGLVLPDDLAPGARIAEPLRERFERGIPEWTKQRMGLETLSGYNPLVPWRFFVYVRYASGLDPFAFASDTTSVAVHRARPPLLDRLAVTHYLYAPGREGGPWRWQRAAAPLPRAHLAPGPVIVPEPEGEERARAWLETLRRLEAMDPRASVMLHGASARAALDAVGAVPGAALAPFREVVAHERRAHRIALRVETERPAILVLAEPWFPGWRARDGGREIPVLRANFLLCALALSPGAHELELVFAPRSWRVGRALSAAALALASLGLGVAGARRLAARGAW